MEPRYETELIKNCLIPMSDGITLAADLYRPRAEERFPALVSFTCYHKDGWYGMAYGELMRAMAQVGYVVLAVDVRGTGNAEGSTQFVRPSEAGRDYYVIITTDAGLYRYAMNDIVRVTGHFEQTPTLRFVQKGKGVTSITGEKLYEGQVIEAVNGALEALDLSASFFVALAECEESRYRLLVELPAGDSDALAARVDHHLAAIG